MGQSTKHNLGPRNIAVYFTQAFSFHATLYMSGVVYPRNTAVVLYMKDRTCLRHPSLLQLQLIGGLCRFPRGCFSVFLFSRTSTLILLASVMGR